jgi:hypothetical protein
MPCQPSIVSIELREMKDRRDAPRDNFTPALEAIRGLLLPELNQILSAGWMDAQSAHTEIEHALINHRTGHFYRHFLPLQKNLVSLLAGCYRRLFKLGLAHPRQVGCDPHEWACVQLQPFVGLSLEWIHDWYILACDGENQYVRHIGRIEFVPGTTASLPLPTTLSPFPPAKSWRAPAWLFEVGPPVGIMLLNTENVPARDSEEKLGAAHTRLLLKGARRVFLWGLEAAIETVRNEEIAAAGAIPQPTITVQPAESDKRKGSKREFKGTEGLGQKKADLSQYMLDMTDKQRLAFSLKYEHELRLAEIASRMGIDRTTAREHLDAANKRLEQNRAFEKRRANRSKSNREE